MAHEYFATSLQHLLAELACLEVLIRTHVQRARQAQAVAHNLQGLVISEEEIEALLAQPLGMSHWATLPAPLGDIETRAGLDRMADDIARCKAESGRRGITLRLDELARWFELTLFDMRALLIALAPELDLKYEKLFAYLQDDITKKQPSVDVVLNLLCPSFEAKLAARQRFTRSAPLLRYHLLSLFADASSPQSPLLAHALKVDARIAHYLLDSDAPDARLVPSVRHLVPQVRLEEVLLADGLKRCLWRFISDYREEQDGHAVLGPSNTRGVVLYFQGPYGVGKQTTAEALCQELGINLLVVDGEQVSRVDVAAFATTVQLAMREALLQHAALYWEGFAVLLAEDKQAWRHVFVRELEQRRGVTFLAGDTAWEPADALHDSAFVRLEFPLPSYSERVHLWQLTVHEASGLGPDVDLRSLANRFRLTGGQIRDAAATARSLVRRRDAANGPVTMADLAMACRLQSNHKLATLAQKITPHYTWEDIVLPADRLQQLREMCNTVHYRARVYDEWGFDRKLSLGKGVNVLFAGPSGTGKTMAAEVIAEELQLDLYKIDLSTVVSKYIGETEKNLARIFAEATTSNAILFFDEADALFGKRSEVKDAHDRYANIEIGYLLQKMEEYAGVVILATNLRKNMDDAFVRRMHFTVEFPFPNAQDRCRIWERMWPDQTPRSPEVALDVMAHRFELAGGNIRNIALAAAFLAASDGGVVTMAHLLHATRREYQKMGTVVEEREFEQFAGP